MAAPHRKTSSSVLVVCCVGKVGGPEAAADVSAPAAVTTRPRLELEPRSTASRLPSSNSHNINIDNIVTNIIN